MSMLWKCFCFVLLWCIHRYRKARKQIAEVLFMCPLLALASKGKLLLFFSFFVAAAIDSTTEANKAPLSSLYSLDFYGCSIWSHCVCSILQTGQAVQATAQSIFLRRLCVYGSDYVSITTFSFYFIFNGKKTCGQL